MAWEGSVPVATITVAREGEPELWSEAERAEPAIYCHKLSVARAYAGRGLGAELIDWAGGIAHQERRRWLRLDAWDTNTSLHRYYRSQGFRFVRVADRPPSGVLFQRPASPYTPRLLRVVSDEPGPIVRPASERSSWPHGADGRGTVSGPCVNRAPQAPPPANRSI
jgi:hypothetical protein